MSIISNFINWEKIRTKRQTEKRRWLRRPLFERVSIIEQNWRDKGELFIREEMESRLRVRYPVKIAH